MEGHRDSRGKYSIVSDQEEADTDEAFVAMDDDHPSIVVDEHLENESGSNSGTEEDVSIRSTGQPSGLTIPNTEVEEAESASTPTSPSPDIIPKTLHQIARDGDVTLLNTLPDDRLKELAKRVNDLDEKLLTPLHYAARYSNLKMIQCLLTLGADLNKKGDDDMTPLHYAARYTKKASNHALKALRQLQKRASIVDGLNEDEVSPSQARKFPNFGDESTPGSPARRISDAPDFVAANGMSDQVMKLLIEHGADVNARDKYHLTALHHAAIRGHVTAIKRLMQTPGIEKEPCDVQNSTPLHLAATYNHVNATSVILEENANPRCKDNDKRTPLHEACLEGNLEIAQLLLEKCKKKFGTGYIKEMLRDRDEEGFTPLLLGVGSGRSAIVQLLLEHKANVNTTSKTMMYPVHSAARIGDFETIRILVENKARLDCRNALMQTPLFLAAQNNHVEVVRYLVEHGASIDLWDSDGLSPLLIAACEGHDDVVATLILLGARLDLADNDEKSALYWAAEQNHPKVVRTLLSHTRGRDLLVLNDQYDNQPVHIAAAKGNVEVLRILLEAGAEIDNKNEDEQTPIHLAAINGRPKVVELIVEKDPTTVNDTDEDGNTALHLSCTHKKRYVTEILLEKGADIQGCNAKKWTPLDCAAASGAYHCAKLLLDNDAPIDPIDRSKTTPLHLAAENGHDKMILLLLSNGANIASEDAYGRNMLELAILSRKRHVVKTVLQHKDWRKAMRTTFTVADKHGTLVPETPMRLLVRIYPDLAEMVFDQCITVDKTASEDQILPKSTMIWRAGAKIKMDYEFIDDAFNLEKKVKSNGEDETCSFVHCPVDSQNNLKKYDYQYDANGKVVMDNHPLMIMAEKKHKNLLRHPLCLGLVRHKWKAFGKYLFYGSLFLYSLFLFFLTSYILVAPNPALIQNATKCSLPSDSAFFKNKTARDLRLPERSNFQLVCQIGIMFLVAINILLELVQWYRAGRRYFQWTNLFDWAVYILSFLLVFDMEQKWVNNGIRTCWQWEMGAIVVVMAWLNLLGDVRQLPFLGIYVIMFFDILKTFLKFVLVFMVFLIAFALGFHTLLISREDSPFSTYGYSTLKTAVMMLGEFEFDALFFPDDAAHLPFEASTVILFIVFMVVMSIIIMNLLIGLAVDDIKAVQEQAVLKRLAMQVELVLDVERLLPAFLLRRFSTQVEVIERKTRHWWSVFTDVVSSRSIVKEVTSLRQVIGLEDVMERQDFLEESLRTLSKEIRNISSDNERIKEILMSIADHQNVSIAGDEDLS